MKPSDLAGARIRATGLACCLLAATAVARTSAAGEVRAAVAANFAPCLEAIADTFESDTGHTVLMSSASTGVLFAQITAGAPFDVFFAADAERPLRLEEDGLAVAGSRFTYAVGRLVLWSPALDGGLRSAASGADLAAALDLSLAADGAVLALTSPRHAPYGAAARTALIALGRWDALAETVATGLNVGQTWQYVATGNAAAGFVALSQVYGARLTDPDWRCGQALIVPPRLHEPIVQQAVLLVPAAENAAAISLLEYVHGGAAGAILSRFGYGTPDGVDP